MKQELILIRNTNDLDCLTAELDEKLQVTINKIYWKMPHVSVDIPQQLNS